MVLLIYCTITLHANTALLNRSQSLWKKIDTAPISLLPLEPLLSLPPTFCTHGTNNVVDDHMRY